jgi:hypothetical protein
METKRDKPPREPMSCRSMVQQMMERMCGTDECSPAAMCKRMMASMETTKDTDAQATPEASTSSEEQARSVDDEAPGGCCGPQARSAPKRP